MKKWNVYLYYTVIKIVEVDAESEEEAIAKALDDSHASLCYRCRKDLYLSEVLEDECEAEEVDEE